MVHEILFQLVFQLLLHVLLVRDGVAARIFAQQGESAAFPVRSLFVFGGTEKFEQERGNEIVDIEVAVFVRDHRERFGNVVFDFRFVRVRQSCALEGFLAAVREFCKYLFHGGNGFFADVLDGGVFGVHRIDEFVRLFRYVFVRKARFVEKLLHPFLRDGRIVSAQKVFHLFPDDVPNAVFRGRPHDFLGDLV